LTLVAATLVRNLDQIADFTSGLGRVSIVLVVLMAVVVGALLIARRRRHRDAPPG
jgi:ABC-type glucose/galactose transport system permease subunit